MNSSTVLAHHGAAADRRQPPAGETGPRPDEEHQAQPASALRRRGALGAQRVARPDTEIDYFFWCPEAAYSDEASIRSEQAAARAEQSFRISEKTLARITERDKPDGLLSVARFPRWDPAAMPLPDGR